MEANTFITAKKKIVYNRLEFLWDVRLYFVISADIANFRVGVEKKKLKNSKRCSIICYCVSIISKLV